MGRGEGLGVSGIMISEQYFFLGQSWAKTFFRFPIHSFHNVSACKFFFHLVGNDMIFQRFLCWYLGPLSGKKDEYPVLTFDAKLAYQDENDTNWKQMAEAIEDRELKCELHSISVSELTVLLSFAVNRSDKENHIVSRIPCRSK